MSCKDPILYIPPELYTMVNTVLSVAIYVDLHVSNFVLGFSPPNETVENIVVNSAAPVDDPETYFDERKVDSKMERIYISQPLTLADEEPFILEIIAVKITDFGYGFIHFTV